MKPSQFIACLFLIGNAYVFAQDDFSSDTAASVDSENSRVQVEQEVETGIETEGTQTQDSDRTIEQIDITGERSLLSMRNTILRQEDSMYRLFNDLNSADKFDVFCKSTRPTGSYIPERSCEPVFFSDLKRASGRFAISEIRQAYTDGAVDLGILQNGLDRLESSRELRQQASGDFEALSEEMLRIAMENPDYRAALERLATLKGDYELARKLKFRKSVV